MDPVECLRRQGGVGTAGQLVSVFGRAPVAVALKSGLLVRSGRGRLALPVVAESLRLAHGVTGVLSHEGAALHHGWELARAPERVSVTVPPNRKARDRTQVRFRYRSLATDDLIAPGVTAPLRTVLDCATDLPFGEALAIADSALRHGHVDADEIRLAASASPSRGRQRRLRVAAHASALSANPFESVLRAIAIEVGLGAVPNPWIYTPLGWVRPDVLDDARGLAIEAESFTWHGQRKHLDRDCRKYNALSQMGLTLRRFSWEQVFHDEAYVRGVLADARNANVRWEGLEQIRRAGHRRPA